ncbi:rod shape-determining protein MreC [Desulforamulus hydrothermalis]|uniref:Cell shape-determining protein MreC n=1 Tax=Desulforamulus hydrothermalis Lam5 = DSM 18033 TaxID=1121428 RepID=K8E849_9FIRM|nr:rod shape-determining protein MreC [Desulforamulus hydrothermalis]CCO07678.1 Rod shape-determining protein MreC [Desulforamulus hydrothermalis Lam5 = DSM 18033]SHH25173.1 rod shape-determining protein MreC [Desulforamulus hydrothermalis Lam5 = DSM 18033]
MPRFVSYKNFFLLTVLVGVTLLVMRFTHLERPRLTPLEAAVKDSLAPVQGVLMKMAGTLRNGTQFIVSLGRLEEENKELKEQVSLLKGRLYLQEELKQENKRLKELLQYKDRYQQNFSVKTAAVIGRDPGNWFGVVTLNKGSKDGILKNMPVVTPAGLVGKIVAVSATTAQLMLITDPRSGVGAMVQETRIPGVLEGSTAGSEETRLIHVPKDTELANGQTIITSGIGGTFPKGIPIGKITAVSDEPTGLFKTATVVPFADLHRLEEVLVITTVYNPDLLPPMEGN